MLEVIFGNLSSIFLRIDLGPFEGCGPTPETTVTFNDHWDYVQHNLSPWRDFVITWKPVKTNVLSSPHSNLTRFGFIFLHKLNISLCDTLAKLCSVLHIERSHPWTQHFK